MGLELALASSREAAEKVKEERLQLHRERGEATRLQREVTMSQMFAKKMEQVAVRQHLIVEMCSFCTTA